MFAVPDWWVTDMYCFLNGRPAMMYVEAIEDSCIFQIRKEGNRHLVDLRPIETLPQAELIDGVRVITAAELIARKVISLNSRRGQPKSGTDWRDVAMLLLAFPKLKAESGPVSEILSLLGATEEEMKTWNEVVHQEISKPDDDAEFD